MFMESFQLKNVQNAPLICKSIWKLEVTGEMSMGMSYNLVVSVGKRSLLKVDLITVKKILMKIACLNWKMKHIENMLVYDEFYHEKSRTRNSKNLAN